jgi:hypothetical protein
VKLKSVFLAFLVVLVLFSSGMCVPVLAQDEQILWPRAARDFWEMVNADFTGPLDLDRDYSFSFTVPQTLVEEFSHTLEAAASDGRTRIFDVMSVAPSTEGSNLWTSTHMGHDDLGTGSALTASERTASGRCNIIDFDTRTGFGSILNTGFDASVMRGAVHSNTVSGPGIMDYHFSANGEALVTARAAASAGSGNATRTFSQQNYSQSITVGGDIEKFDYVVEINGGDNSLCGPW